MAVKFLFFRLSALSISLLVGASALMAQDYYDDDIYYDASKAKKETKGLRRQKITSRVILQSRLRNIIMTGLHMCPGIM